jgi:hypothetical protein
MQRYFLSKLGQSILLLVGVLILVFFMLRITGDPASLMLSREASPEQVAAFREAMGFNRPLIAQFWTSSPARCKATSASRFTIVRPRSTSCSNVCLPPSNSPASRC